MFEQYKDKFPQLKDKWEKYAGMWKKVQVPANTMLLSAGEVSKEAFVIEKGCARVWFSSHGKDITFQFVFENEVASSPESFRKGIASTFNIETLEPCTLYVLSRENWQMMTDELAEVPGLCKAQLDGIMERQYRYVNHFMSFITESPKDRYIKLVQERPLLIQRIPLQYIASYLGISPTLLSRIRNQVN